MGSIINPVSSRCWRRAVTGKLLVNDTKCFPPEFIAGVERVCLDQLSLKATVLLDPGNCAVSNPVSPVPTATSILRYHLLSINSFQMSSFSPLSTSFKIVVWIWDNWDPIPFLLPHQDKMSRQTRGRPGASGLSSGPWKEKQEEGKCKLHLDNFRRLPQKRKHKTGLQLSEEHLSDMCEEPWFSFPTQSKFYTQSKK